MTHNLFLLWDASFNLRSILAGPLLYVVVSSLGLPLGRQTLTLDAQESLNGCHLYTIVRKFSWSRRVENSRIQYSCPCLKNFLLLVWCEVSKKPLLSYVFLIFCLFQCLWAEVSKMVNASWGWWGFYFPLKEGGECLFPSGMIGLPFHHVLYCLSSLVHMNPHPYLTICIFKNTLTWQVVYTGSRKWKGIPCLQHTTVLPGDKKTVSWATGAMELVQYDFCCRGGCPCCGLWGFMIQLVPQVSGNFHL